MAAGYREPADLLRPCLHHTGTHQLAQGIGLAFGDKGTYLKLVRSLGPLLIQRSTKGQIGSLLTKFSSTCPKTHLKR
jgi:hypothetical protein